MKVKRCRMGEVRWILEEMKDIAKNFDHIEPAMILTMADYPRNNITTQEAQGSSL